MTATARNGNGTLIWKTLLLAFLIPLTLGAIAVAAGRLESVEQKSDRARRIAADVVETKLRDLKADILREIATRDTATDRRFGEILAALREIREAQKGGR